MKKRLPPKLLVVFFVLFNLQTLAGLIGFSHAQSFLKRLDTGVSFPRDLHTTTVEFKLASTGEKKFKIILDRKNNSNTRVKIYDILGNLIKEDFIKPEDGTEKTFDFSHINSQLFVVEVGNSKYNQTKSVYAQPQGKPKNTMDAE
jgi:hypothetical protein